MQDFLTIKEVEQLKKSYRACRNNKRHADRIRTILALNEGYSYADVARILMLDDSSLRNYYAEYTSGGVEALLTDNYKGGTSYMNSTQLQLLEKHLGSHTYPCAKEIQAYIYKTYGIRYSVEGIKKLLHRMDFVYKKSKHVPGKADKAKQEAFIKAYEALKVGKKPEDKIYFMDGVHPRHNSVPAYGWIKKGTEKQLPANTGRARLNINGAYEIEEHKVIIREDERINAQSTIALLEQMFKEQPLGMIYIILDNARYYRSKLVSKFLEDNTRIQFVFLPAYSPNLNVIERLWKFFKKKKLHDKYYEKFAVFRQECLSFFENIHLYEDELKTLMTDNFHVIQPDPSFSKT